MQILIQIGNKRLYAESTWTLYYLRSIFCLFWAILDDLIDFVHLCRFWHFCYYVDFEKFCQIWTILLIWNNFVDSYLRKQRQLNFRAKSIILFLSRLLDILLSFQECSLLPWNTHWHKFKLFVHKFEFQMNPDFKFVSKSLLFFPQFSLLLPSSKL